MPRDTSLRKQFVSKAKAKAPAKKKAPKKPAKAKELFGERSIRMQIAYAAQDLKHVTIRYKKATTGEIKRYTVAPYSYRWRRAKSTGRRQKCLYANDPADKHIKSFYIKNIKGVEPSSKKFSPKWIVEIGS